MLIYTGYLDESGTHQGSPVTVMGGLMGSARQWSAFAKTFTQIKKSYGFEIFHTKKFKARSGEFSGWSPEKSMSLLRELAFATEGTFTEGVAMTLENDDYEKYYKTGTKPNKLRLDSKYGLCFRQCLLLFIIEVIKRRHRDRVPYLNIVLESGHPNAGDAVRIFEEMQEDFKKAGHDFLRSITIAEKDSCDPLMLADFVAHSTFILDRKSREFGHPIKPPTKPKATDAAITQIRFKPGGLANIKNELVSQLTKKGRYGQTP